MNLNQVTVPCLDLDESVDFYLRLGLELIVLDRPKYARFQCPQGGSTFSLHLADHVESVSAPVVYFAGVRTRFRCTPSRRPARP